MSLPDFQPQAQLFSYRAVTGQLFAPDNKYDLFSRTIYPLIMQHRCDLQAAYCLTNGRPAEEPVEAMALTVLQFMENVTDREAVELAQYHLGWARALNRPLGEEVFHPSVLSRFRGRLARHQKAQVAFT